jgi:hypothetical protein
MKLNKTWKVIIGLLTVMIIFGPFIIVAVVFATVGDFIFIENLSQLSDQEASQLIAVMSSTMVVMIIGGIVQTGISIFYLVHAIMNKAGKNILRILLTVGVFFLPYIAMPFYYFVYIWPETPPEWALDKQNKEI